MTLEDDLARLEGAVLKTTGARKLLAVVARLRLILATGGSDAEVQSVVLQLKDPYLEGQALAAVSEAFGVGRDSGLSLVGRGAKKAAKATAKEAPSRAARSPLLGIDDLAATLLGKAQLLAALGNDAATVAAPVLAIGNAFTGRVTQAVNAGGNEGVRAVAKAAGTPVVWIAETNACVHCLAYAGQVSPAGKKFPGGLTFGAKSYFPDAIATPPRHPNCRCTLEPLNDQSYADALQREAERSILRGFSLESESMKVRLDAAQRLLDRGTNAPKSVQAYARRAIKDGSFPTRDRPTR